MKLKQLTAYDQEAEFISLDITGSDELEHSLDSEFEEMEDQEDKRQSHDKREPDNTPDPNYRLLSAYFKDLSSEGLLKKRDEVILASKIKICTEKTDKINNTLGSKSYLNKSESDKKALQALKHLYESKSMEAKDKFIKSNLRLVIELSNRYMGKGLPLGDLIQEGNIGLMKAVIKFDHTKGFKFSTYAAWWIHQALSRATMEQTNVIPIPVYLQEMTSKVYKAKNKIEHNRDTTAEPEQIAGEAKVSVDSVKTILHGRDLVVPIELNSEDGESKTYLDIAPDPESKRPEFYLTIKSIKKEIRGSLGILNERERDVLKMRFGIDYEDDHKLDQIASKYSLSRERIRQIESEALGKLARSERSYVLKSLLN
jgi:RNA polymerase nonessential primary-like sigma factor